MQFERVMKISTVSIAILLGVVALSVTQGCRSSVDTQPILNEFFSAVKAKNAEALVDFLDPEIVAENELDTIRSRVFIEGMLGALPAELLNLSYSEVDPPKSFGTPGWSKENQVVVDAKSSHTGAVVARITFKRSGAGWRTDVFEVCSLLSSKHGSVKERMRRLGVAFDRAGLRALKRPGSRMMITRERIGAIADGNLAIENAFEPY